MNENEANTERVRDLSESIYNTVLDAINRLPPAEKQDALHKLRAAVMDGPTFQIVDDTLPLTNNQRPGE